TAPPDNVTVPESCGRSPLMTSIRVDFPAPLGLINPVIELSGTGTVSRTLLRAGSSLNVTVTSDTVNTSSLSVGSDRSAGSDRTGGALREPRLDEVWLSRSR